MTNEQQSFILEFTLAHPTGKGARYEVSGGELRPNEHVIGSVILSKDLLFDIGHETIPAMFSAVITLPAPVSKADKLAREAISREAPPKEAGTVEVDGVVVFTPSRGHVTPAPVAAAPKETP